MTAAEVPYEATQIAPRGKRVKYAVEASMNVPNISRAKSALTLQVRKRGRILGELTIGHGLLRWRTTKEQKSAYLPWGDFADIIEQQDRRRVR